MKWKTLYTNIWGDGALSRGNNSAKVHRDRKILEALQRAEQLNTPSDRLVTKR